MFDLTTIQIMNTIGSGYPLRERKSPAFLRAMSEAMADEVRDGRTPVEVLNRYASGYRDKRIKAE